MAKRDLVVKSGSQQRSQRKAEMTEIPLKNLSNKDEYQKPKWPIIYLTKSQTEQAVFKDTSPNYADLFRPANLMKHGNLDDQGIKPVHYDAGELCLENMTKQAA